jgi:hypothetical protein
MEGSAILATAKQESQENMSDFEERVRSRAYKIWEEEGCPEGRGEIHWEMARELIAIGQLPRDA